MARVITIGIVGPSGCGKSSVAQALRQVLGSDGTSIIGEDGFHATKLPPNQSYADRDPISETPANVEWPRLIDAVRERKLELANKSTKLNKQCVRKHHSDISLLCFWFLVLMLSMKPNLGEKSTRKGQTTVKMCSWCVYVCFSSS